MLISIRASAQTNIDPNGRSFGQIFDSLATGLIPSRIPYGNLYSRTYGWSGLDEWNNNDTTSLTQIFQGWYDAEESVINPANRPQRYEAMRKRNELLIGQGKLPIILLQYQFGFFDSLAVEDGRLSVTDGFISDNNAALPYYSKQVMLAALGRETVGEGRTYSVQIDTALVHNNTGQTLQAATLYNSTTASSYSLPLNGSPQNISFTQPGLNVIQFTLTYSNGTYTSY